MKSLCVVADTHQRHREIEIPRCDVLIHCGDFCHFGKGLDTLEDADVWFAETEAPHVISIGGNHDQPLQQREFQFTHSIFLEDRLVEIEGTSFYGAPWCPELVGFAYYATETELLQHWRQIPSGIDVLITHTPPAGILDVPSSGTTHLGCPLLRQEIQRIRPRLHVFAHVHVSHGIQVELETTFCNAAIVGGNNYEVRHGASLIELP